MTLIRTLNLDDTSIEIHHSNNLKHKPFLLRIYTFDNYPYEIRFDNKDLTTITEFITIAIKEKGS
jgi:hypothetical protein